jgi:phosphate transport system substrate-binding protein
VLVAGGVYAITHFLHLESSSTSKNSDGDAPDAKMKGTILRLSGSNTIGAQLGPDLVQAWLLSRGATDLNRTSSASDETTITGKLDGVETTVSVKAHGSATAFADLASNSADIGMASRKVKPREASDLQARGMSACWDWTVWQ